MTVMITDAYAPYLRANQYVNYQADSEVVKKAAELVQDKTTALEKIAAVYKYTITTLTYDQEKAKTVQTGYLPDVDKVLAEQIDVGMAIYSAVMVAVVGGSALLLYLTVYKKLKKEQEEARKTIILPPINNGGGNSEIFRGYGL